MPDILYLLHDYAFLQVVAGFLAIFVAILVAYITFRRDRKDLRYEILCNESLFKVRDGDESLRITVYFDNEPVKNVNVLIIKLINCGNVAIRKADYDENISICMGEKAKILHADILEEYPLGITGNNLINNNDIAINNNDIAKYNTIKLNKILLNRGDYFSIKIIGRDFDQEIKIDGRIADVTITKIKKFEKKLLISKGPVLLGVFIGIIIFLLINKLIKY